MFSKLDVSMDEDCFEDEVEKRVQQAKKEADDVAQATRKKHNEKVAALCARIAQLKRELNV